MNDYRFSPSVRDAFACIVDDDYTSFSTSLDSMIQLAPDLPAGDATPHDGVFHLARGIQHRLAENPDQAETFFQNIAAAFVVVALNERFDCADEDSPGSDVEAFLTTAWRDLENAPAHLREMHPQDTERQRAAHDLACIKRDLPQLRQMLTDIRKNLAVALDDGTSWQSLANMAANACTYERTIRSKEIKVEEIELRFPNLPAVTVFTT